MSEADVATLRRMAAHEPVAVALVEAAAGSTPRAEGAWMIVAPDRTAGTIGGGEAERRTVEAARALLRRGALSDSLDLSLGPDLDQYGAGHVGTALARALEPLPFGLTWVDARAESIWPAEGPVPCRRLALPETAATAAPDEALHVVMTHSHAVDLEIVAAVLARPFRFLGLIGSATKRATFARRLAGRGLDTSRLTCPIGLPEIRGKAPAVIAASVAAQLLSITGGDRR